MPSFTTLSIRTEVNGIVTSFFNLVVVIHTIRIPSLFLVLNNLELVVSSECKLAHELTLCFGVSLEFEFGFYFPTGHRTDNEVFRFRFRSKRAVETECVEVKTSCISYDNVTSLNRNYNKRINFYGFLAFFYLNSLRFFDDTTEESIFTLNKNKCTVGSTVRTGTRSDTQLTISRNRDGDEVLVRAGSTTRFETEVVLVIAFSGTEAAGVSIDRHLVAGIGDLCLEAFFVGFEDSIFGKIISSDSFCKYDFGPSAENGSFALTIGDTNRVRAHLLVAGDLQMISIDVFDNEQRIFPFFLFSVLVVGSTSSNRTGVNARCETCLSKANNLYF